MVSDKTILSLGLLLTTLVILLFAVMFSYYALLKRLARRFPAYYRQLGSPFLPSASWAMTKTIKNDGSNYRFILRLVQGVPNDLPLDGRLKRYALTVRIEILVILAVILGGAVLGLKQ